MKQLSFNNHFRFKNATLLRNGNYSLLIKDDFAIKIYNENKTSEELKEEFDLQKELYYGSNSKYIPRPDSLISLVDDSGKIVEGIKMDWNKNLIPLNQLDSWGSPNKRPKLVQRVQKSNLFSGASYTPSIDDIFVKKHPIIPSKMGLVYCGLENLISLNK